MDQIQVFDLIQQLLLQFATKLIVMAIITNSMDFTMAKVTNTKDKAVVTTNTEH